MNELIRNVPASDPANYDQTPLALLAEFLEGAKEELETVKKQVELIEKAISKRVEESVALARRMNLKPEGTIHVVVEGCDVKHVVPKRLEWNQDVLREAVAKLQALGVDVEAKGIKFKLDVGIKDWERMPKEIADMISPGLTIKHGKPTFEVTAS
jgi:hypothetical protein